MIKVLFLIHDLGYGGAERVLVNLANNLDKSKFDVTIQSIFDVGINKKFIDNSVHYIGGLKKMFRGNVPLMKLFSPKILCKLLIKDEYDLIVSFLEGPSSRIVSACKGKKIAWIHIEHPNIEALAYPFKSYDEMINCYNSFDRIVCVAQTVKNNFLELSGVSAPCEVLYNVNQTDLILKMAEEEQSSIIKSEECVNIISVGRLIIKHKGFERLISIHKKLLNDGIQNNLYILGEGEDHQKLQGIIDSNNLNDSCFLLGFQVNPYKLIKNADLFVCSSYKEGFSTAVTEALILGVPVVSTNVSGAYELLGKNNEYGIVTDNDENALYEGIITMLNSNNLNYYKDMAKKRGNEFSAEKTTKAVEKMFESLR